MKKALLIISIAFMGCSKQSLTPNCIECINDTIVIGGCIEDLPPELTLELIDSLHTGIGFECHYYFD